MAKTNKLINKPIDRDYFKYKDRPKPKDTKRLTPCCDQDLDHEMLNVNDKKDWDLIEEYIEDKLFVYSDTESITPVSCKKCGRLLNYLSKIKDPKGTKGWFN
jgi:hypothetical protein|tara:strand:- start:981 stop:1286 length:306 start_codon:yes stop_codon:yes gene_type:complete